MRFESTSRSRALSQVISAVIISAVVMAVGGAVWAFSQGAMTITAEDYAEAVINMTDTISERFIVEHVSNNSDGSVLYVWGFNHGKVDIEFKVEIGDVIYPVDSNSWVSLSSKEIVKVELTGFSASPKDEFNVRMYSRRGNNAYYKYLVP